LPGDFKRAFTSVVGLAMERERFISLVRAKLLQEGLRTARVMELELADGLQATRAMSEDLRRRVRFLSKRDPVDFGAVHMFPDAPECE